MVKPLDRPGAIHESGDILSGTSNPMDSPLAMGSEGTLNQPTPRSLSQPTDATKLPGGDIELYRAEINRAKRMGLSIDSLDLDALDASVVMGKDFGELTGVFDSAQTTAEDLLPIHGDNLFFSLGVPKTGNRELDMSRLNNALDHSFTDAGISSRTGNPHTMGPMDTDAQISAMSRNEHTMDPTFELAPFSTKKDADLSRLVHQLDTFGFTPREILEKGGMGFNSGEAAIRALEKTDPGGANILKSMKGTTYYDGIEDIYEQSESPDGGTIVAAYLSQKSTSKSLNPGILFEYITDETQHSDDDYTGNGANRIDLFREVLRQPSRSAQLDKLFEFGLITDEDQYVIDSQDFQKVVKDPSADEYEQHPYKIFGDRMSMDEIDEQLNWDDPGVDGSTVDVLFLRQGLTEQGLDRKILTEYIRESLTKDERGGKTPGQIASSILKEDGPQAQVDKMFEEYGLISDEMQYSIVPGDLDTNISPPSQGVREFSEDVKSSDARVVRMPNADPDYEQTPFMVEGRTMSIDEISRQLDWEDPGVDGATPDIIFLRQGMTEKGFDRDILIEYILDSTTKSERGGKSATQIANQALKKEGPAAQLKELNEALPNAIFSDEMIDNIHISTLKSRK